MPTYIDAGWRWPGVVCAQCAGNHVVAELRARLVHAEEFKLCKVS